MICFLTLRIFSATGGIEKVCRTTGKILFEYGLQNNRSVHVTSMHDKQQDAYHNKYFPAEMFSGYGGKKISFVLNAVRKGKNSDTVILSHINLLSVGWLIKKTSPSVKLILYAHGIEIWNDLNERTLAMLQQCDLIICVSSYTRERIIKKHCLTPGKLIILNNCLDPFLENIEDASLVQKLRKRYKLAPRDKIVFTLARLSSAEKYKGYDKVLYAISNIRSLIPDIKYMIGGGYDQEEKKQIEDIARQLGIEDRLMIVGYIDQIELSAHFQLSDVYAMPSKEEGFGIVFIEAMFYGLPVIAGNMDGSTDALLNGKLGMLVDPLNVEQLGLAISKAILKKDDFPKDQAMAKVHFAYENYKKNLVSHLR